MVRRHLNRLLILATATAVATAAAVSAALPASAALPIGAVNHLPILAVNSLPTVIGNITAWFVGLAFGVATLFATYAFFLYLSAGGDTTTIEKAKTAVKGALFGYAGALLAPVLLGIVRGWIGG